MNILIFKTEYEERTKKLLGSIDLGTNHVYMVLPESEVSIYNGHELNIYCIVTGEKYIKYETVKKENRIPKLMFHELWVPSPDFGNIYTYWEIYTVISELKCRKIYYKVIDEGGIRTCDLRKEPVFSYAHALLVEAVRMYMSLCHRIEKKIEGHK